MSVRCLFTFLIYFTYLPSVSAQDSAPQPNEKFVPAEQLDTVFDRDRRGVMMKRDEFKALLEKARANVTANTPIPIIAEHASLKVIPGDQQALVTMELKVRQYAEGWQMLRIRAGNLLVEKMEIDGRPALIGRDPADPSTLLLAHDKTGEFTVVVSMSTQIATLGSDRTAAFQLPMVPAVQLTVNCPAGRHLLLNDMKLDRPAADDAVTDYLIPVGNAPDVRLRWVVQRRETEAQTLVFVSTDAQLKVQKETLRWDCDSRISVFGGTINKVVARVPATLEVTSVESTGLENWTLDDDPENAGHTRVTLTWRQPFTNDRLVKIKGVSASCGTDMQKIPTLQFGEVTTHTGRLVVTHEDGLRLVSETGGGIRRMSASETGLSTDAYVFEFWLQSFELQVAAKQRDRELFLETSAVLAIDDTTTTFDATLVVETLNAPLFELPISLPVDWQLTSVESPENPAGLTWTATSDTNQILVRPTQPIAPGQLIKIVVKLTRTIADPDSEQKLVLPVVTADDTTSVGGSYIVRFADDLTVAPLSLTGLTPIAGSGTEQVFQNPGTTVSGELSIVRKPSRLASRSVLKTWTDSRQQSTDAEIIADVLNGTIRSLTIRLSESLGPDVRFEVRSVGPVPGIAQTRAIRPVTIIEQSAGTPADGLRPFVLKLDHRFAGSLSLHAFVQQPRKDENTKIAAPVVQVQDAIRQHGVLVFEASPEQQLSVGEEVSSIPGLFVADAGLVDAPELSTGRRIALIYRFVQPGYTFQVSETRFATDTVPSAVCEHLANVCTLNDSGSIQRWCRARIRSSGVQTLRFTLPDAERSFLWSTMLNGEPVEVRRDAADYLVAVPTNSDSPEHVLTVLFESDSRKAGAFGQTDHGPVQFSIDVGKLQAIPIDVLQQTWRVHYPQSSLLIGSDGQFRPTAGVDRPGWLMSLGDFVWPDSSALSGRLIPLAIFMLLLFVVTVAVIRRRWIAVAGVLFVFLGLLLPAIQQPRHSSRVMEERNRMKMRELASEEGLTNSDSQMIDRFDAADQMPSDVMLGEPFEPLMEAKGGLGGGGFGGRKIGDTDAPSAPAPAPVPQDIEVTDAADFPILDKAPYVSRLAKPQKGNARLSVNVNLDVPADYQAREFVSVADAVHQPSVLKLVVQKRGQIAAIRLVAALIVILLAWRMRKAAMLWKLTLAIALLLLAIGVTPLLSNAWQSVVDGITLGALVSVAMALACACRKCCECPWISLKSVFANRPGTASTSSLLLVAAISIPSTHALGQDSTNNQTVPQPDVVIPYSPDEPALRADRVLIRHDDFLKLYQQAYPDALKAPSVSPLGSTVVASFYKAEKLTQVDGTKHILSLDGRFVVWSDSEQAVSLPLPIGPVAIRSIKVDGNDGLVQPLVYGTQPAEIQNFAAQNIAQSQQQAVIANSAKPALEGPAYAVQITGKGFHIIDLMFDIPALLEGELGRADLPLRNAASGTLEWTLPADGLDAKVNGRTNVYRRDDRTIILPIAQLSNIRLQWLPTIQKVAGDVVFHSAVTSAMSVQDSGIMLRTSVAVTCRQGEISELEITIPEGYAVQSVTGDDIAGWAVQNTDATRSVKLQLRRAVNDATSVTLQLFVPAPAKEALALLAVPISIVKGASRDLGTVVLKTGSQFQVRTDSLSAVTQMNPNEAPVPEGDQLPGRPMLAWRYTRHPASVTVKVTPAADELIVESMHAVRLEEQRQLWSSRIALRVIGAPRSRIDIAVPKGFLALDVTATGLKDWYLSDAVEGEGSNAELRTLSVQLQDAAIGQMQVAVQGQMNRDADRSQLKLQPPAVMNATKGNSELAVWLDAASESSGLENGSDWTTKSPASVNPGFREITPSSPSLAFQSQAVQPGPLSVKLRPAISTLIGESVTVTNVTETAVEITLALNWQIARAAADQFAVELPTSVASVMTFDVPGQRRVTRKDLGEGRTQVIIQLQQPITDRLFVLGTASLPLPTDRVIRSEVPNIVIPKDAPSTLSGQAHFWVLVNQSNGLLQPTVDQPADKVRPEQMTTQIPPQLLQQAVAVMKLRPETAAWNLVYPEQFQVAPAVVNLATHTTVISDDGSWRSRHQLQVTNESRQFLPVVLPENSRLMYCLVRGRPSRVVTQGEGEAVRHLIPIPQSGALASAFEVEFALAGRFDDSAASIQNEWKSSRLTIPVPTFPEFRDVPEFGVSVSRNRWSVYVPNSWRATMVDDPEATNVVRAASTELQDASLLSYVEQAESLLKNVKSAQGSFARRKAMSELQSAADKLQRNSGNDSDVERQRGEVLGKLGEVSNDYDVDQNGNGFSDSVIIGNGFLYEQDLRQNQASGSNNLSFFNFNGQRASDFSQQQSQQADPDAAFRFDITIQNLEKQQEFRSLKEEDRKSGEEESKADKSKSSNKTARPESRFGTTDEKAARKDGVEQEEQPGRSQLMQRRAIQSELGQTVVPQFGRPVDMLNETEALGLPGIAQSSPDEMSLHATQQQKPSRRDATPTGLLSLRFDIPTDGQQIDFLRVGGNPVLSLDVRSSEAVSKGTGLIWLVFCVTAILLLIGPGRNGKPLLFCQRLFLILAITGLAAWLFTIGSLTGLGLVLCITGSIAFAATTVLARVAQMPNMGKRTPQP
jgi:hypothetical protein